MSDLEGQQNHKQCIHDRVMQAVWDCPCFLPWDPGGPPDDRSDPWIRRRTHGRLYRWQISARWALFGLPSIGLIKEGVNEGKTSLGINQVVGPT